MYLDSAILIKLSVSEPDSGYYAALVDGRTDLQASALSLPECRSALARKVDGGEISPNEYAESCEEVAEMLSVYSGINVAGVDNEILELASALIERCLGKAVLRALDAVHIATCIKTKSHPLATRVARIRASAKAHRRLG